MLFSLLSLATLLLSTGAGALSTLNEGMPFHDPPVTPQDPSTLALALIGAGTVAVYVALRGRPLRVGPQRPTVRLSDQSEGVEEFADGVEQKPSRGAA